MIIKFKQGANAHECIGTTVISFTGTDIETIPEFKGAQSALLQFYTDAAGMSVVGSAPIAVIDEKGTGITPGYTGTNGFLLSQLSFYAVSGIKNLANVKFTPFASGYTVYCKVNYYKSEKTAIPFVSGEMAIRNALENGTGTSITALQAILAKILVAPATEAKQDTGNTALSTIAGKDFATQATLAAVLAKLIATPATEAKQDTGNTSLSTIDGKLYSAKGNEVSGATGSITGTAATDVLAAPGASTYNYIEAILVTNGHASVSTYVNIIEETSGTILWTGYAAAAGGGFSVSLKSPIKQGTANKKIQAQCVTIGSDVRVCISGFKGA